MAIRGHPCDLDSAMVFLETLTQVCECFVNSAGQQHPTNWCYYRFTSVFLKKCSNFLSTQESLFSVRVIFIHLPHHGPSMLPYCCSGSSRCNARACFHKLCHIQMISLDFRAMRTPTCGDGCPVTHSWDPSGETSNVMWYSVCLAALKGILEAHLSRICFASQSRWKQQIRRGEGHLCTVSGRVLWPIDPSAFLSWHVSKVFNCVTVIVGLNDL